MPLTRRSVLKIVLGSAAIPLLAACGQPAAPAPPTAPAATASAAAGAPAVASAPSPSASSQPVSAPVTVAPSARATSKLSISYSAVEGGVTPFWVAYEAGLFQQHGIEPDFQFIASATGIPAIVSGQIQVGLLGGSSVLSAAAGGADLLMMGILEPVYAYKLEVAPEIKTVDDLRGRNVGVSQFGDASDIAARVCLQKMGLTDKDVTFITTQTHQNRTAALFAGAIQAGVDTPPATLELEAKGFHPLVDLAALKTPSANLCVTAQRQWVQEHHDLMQSYATTVVAGIARMRQDRAFTLGVLEKYLQVSDPAALGETYDYFVQQVIPQQPLLKPEYLADAVEQLSPVNPKIRTVDIPRLIDNSFMQTAIAAVPMG